MLGEAERIVLQPRVTAEHDARTSSGEFRETALQDRVALARRGGLRRRSSAIPRLDLCAEVRRDCIARRSIEPCGERCRHLHVAPALGILQRRHDRDAAPHDRLDNLVIHLLVSDHVREAVDSCGDKAFRVGEVEDVGIDADTVLVRFVDDRAVQRSAQLGGPAVAIVDPDLDEVDLLCGKLPHVAARLVVRRDVVGDAAIGLRARACVRRAHPAAGGEQTRAAETPCCLVIANPERDVAGIDAFRDDRADAEVDGPIEIVDDRLARVVLCAVGRAFLKAGMRVDVDERRHHRFAGEVHARGAGGSLHVSLAPYARDGAVFDEKGGAFNGRFAIAGDQACAFVERGAGRRTRLGMENEPCRGERQNNARRGSNLHDGADYI